MEINSKWDSQGQKYSTGEPRKVNEKLLFYCVFVDLVVRC